MTGGYSPDHGDYGNDTNESYENIQNERHIDTPFVLQRLTDGLSGGRAGGTWLGSQDNYRAASLRADTERPSAGAGVRRA